MRADRGGRGVVFQDALFSPVRVVRYRRKRVGERWVTDKHEAGRVYAWRQLGLEGNFEVLFGSKA